ncbi:N-acetylmuramoyl-L-alanine amidase family protein [Paenibacillus sanguinis]|uniref:N-acetylmuramoyl-L-alanine amidase family protein n=1 Tax=Paenibacillus sanguinis TaxID=225906 RepID=UPI00037E7324|nr:N-acetylmuramoyl-L-alanine amidase family protein [Paenibacillus sanguinis]
MKKLSLILFVMICSIVFPAAAREAVAAAQTHIYLDGQALEQPAGAEAGLVGDKVMVPLRVVAEGLGFEVAWEKTSGTATIKQDDTELKLVVGQATGLVDGEKIELDEAPLIKSERTLVPLRFVSEQMGLEVSWNNVTKSAYLNHPNSGQSSEIVPGTSSPGPVDESVTVPVNEPPADDTDVSIPDSGSSDEESNLSGLALIHGISFSENRLLLVVSGTVEPHVSVMTEPDRIVVDLPNANYAEYFENNFPSDVTGQREMVLENSDVSKIRHSLFNSDPSTVRIVLDLNHKMQYRVNNDGSGLVTVELMADTTAPGHDLGLDGKPVVVIDAGHGGTQPGAISLTKKPEKDFTLAVALKVEALLQQESGIDFVLTRDTDVTMSLQDRVKIANELGADAFVSIHGNSIDPPSNPSGSETYYTRKESLPLANIMHRHLVEATGLTDRKVRNSSLHVTRETLMPAVLLEAGYLSNENDEALMYTEAFQQRLAEGIVAGIKEYFGL